MINIFRTKRRFAGKTEDSQLLQCFSSVYFYCTVPTPSRDPMKVLFFFSNKILAVKNLKSLTCRTIQLHKLNDISLSIFNET